MGKMYEVEREEEGTRTLIYRVIADNEEDAGEKIDNGDIEPESDYFSPMDRFDNFRELDDCDCDICVRRGPWSCVTEDNEL